MIKKIKMTINEYNAQPTNLKHNISRWINDSKTTIPNELKHKLQKNKFDKNCGHFSTPIDQSYNYSGCKIIIDGVDYIIWKIIGDGTDRGSVILNGNPPTGRVQFIYPVEFKYNGCQFPLSDDNLYDTNLCYYDVFGTTGLLLGDLTISFQNYIVNEYAMLIGSYIESDRKIKIDDISGFMIGDEILLHQTQHVDHNRYGLYSYNYIENIDPSTTSLILKFPLGEKFETIRFNILDSSVCQVVKIPHYRNLTITENASIVAKPWNGQYGGILSFRVQDVFLNYGLLSCSGLGFRGGVDYKKMWWNCYPNFQHPSVNYNIEPTGGEGCCGIDSNYGLLYPEPEVHYGNEFPKYDPKKPQCFAYNNIQRSNMRVEYGGGNYIVESQPYYEQARVVKGYGPGSGGGSFTSGEPSSGFSNYCCGHFRTDCSNFFYDISAVGGSKIESLRILRMNFGCGGASGAYYDVYNNRKYTAHGGNGGGLIIIFANSIINYGQIDNNGLSGTLNFCIASEKPNASTAGGGGAGSIYAISKNLYNSGKITLLGGKGFHLSDIDFIKCVYRDSIVHERHTIKSGSGGNGHFAFTCKSYNSKHLIPNVFPSSQERIDNMFDYRLLGYYCYDYRNMWAQSNLLQAANTALLNIRKFSSFEYYIINAYDRNDIYYTSINEFLYGIIIDNELKTYDMVNLNWKPYDIKYDLAITHIDYIKINSDYFLTNTAITHNTNNIGYLFSFKSYHQLYSPIISSIDYVVNDLKWNIWNNFKYRNVNTVPSSKFVTLMKN